MGAADIVPGVSGGTVALILGVYERLLAAISRFDGKLLGLVARRDLPDAAKHVDFRFLGLLGVGIAAGVVGLATPIHHALEHHRSLTFAAFFGLILASGVIVGRMARPNGPSQIATCIILGVLAAGFAFWIVTLDRVAPIAALPYTFLCGSIAICAMILPGISGAYLLLLLGKYEEVTGILKRLPKLEVGTEDLVTVAVFAAGCAIGLLLFSRLLRWLLARHHALTMAVLCGFMIGSLYRVWPLQRDTTPEIEEFKRKVFQPEWPTSWTNESAACAAVAVACFAVVLVADALARSKRPSARESVQP